MVVRRYIPPHGFHYIFFIGIGLVYVSFAAARAGLLEPGTLARDALTQYLGEGTPEATS